MTFLNRLTYCFRRKSYDPEQAKTGNKATADSNKLSTVADLNADNLADIRQKQADRKASESLKLDIDGLTSRSTSSLRSTSSKTSQ